MEGLWLRCGIGGCRGHGDDAAQWDLAELRRNLNGANQ